MSHPAAVGAASSCPRKFSLTCDITQLSVCHAPSPTDYVSPRCYLPYIGCDLDLGVCHAPGHWPLGPKTAQWINYQIVGVFEIAFHNRKMKIIKCINILGLFDNFLLVSIMYSCIHCHLLKKNIDCDWYGVAMFSPSNLTSRMAAYEQVIYLIVNWFGLTDNSR